jgi:hypothetical protein
MQVRQERTTPPLSALLAALDSNKDAQVKTGLRMYSTVLLNPVPTSQPNEQSRALVRASLSLSLSLPPLSQVADRHLVVDGRHITDTIKDVSFPITFLFLFLFWELCLIHNFVCLFVLLHKHVRLHSSLAQC